MNGIPMVLSRELLGVPEVTNCTSRQYTFEVKQVFFTEFQKVSATVALNICADFTRGITLYCVG